MKLISMTDFVLEQSKKIMNCELTHLESHHQIVGYANFLKQPLKLEMFVPCDEDGNILEKPELIDERYNLKLLDYEQALEKVLFKCFYIKMYDEPKDGILGVIKDDNFQFKGIWFEGEEGFRLNDISAKQTIEDLRTCTELTPNAIKKLWL